MVVISKKVGVEVVAKTSITSPVMAVKKALLAGITRKIEAAGIDINTVVREYVKSNDLMQSAAFSVLDGSGITKDNMIDWNDSTYVSVIAPKNAPETDWFQFDFGVIKTFYLFIQVYIQLTPTLYVKVSDDGINWSTVKSFNGSTGTYTFFGKVTGRYVKLSYVNPDSVNTYEFRVYSIEAFEDADASAVKSTYMNSLTLSLVHEVQTRNEAVSVVIDSNSCSYRIVDIDSLATSYVEVVSG